MQHTKSLAGVVAYRRADGALTDVGEGAGELFGHEGEALVAEKPALLALVALADRERVARAWRGEHPGLLRFRCLSKEGALRHVEERQSPDGCGLWIDRSEEVREAERRDAQRLMRKLGDLAGGIVHEVNNSLAGIVNYARLAERLAGKDPRLAEVAAGILSESDRVFGTVDVLRSLAPRPEGEGPRAVEAADVLRGVLGLVRAPLRDDGVRYALATVPEGIPPVTEIGHGLHLALLLMIETIRDGKPTSLVLSVSAPSPSHVEFALDHDASIEGSTEGLLLELLSEQRATLKLSSPRATLRVPAYG